MTDKKTVLFRLCAGCDAPLGLQLVPWAGSPFESTHALCTACHRQIDAALGRSRFNPEFGLKNLNNSRHPWGQLPASGPHRPAIDTRVC